MKWAFWADSGGVFTETGRFCCPFAFSGRTLAVMSQQSLLGDHQVRQGEQGMQLRGVVGRTLVAILAMTEQVLDDMERMRDAGVKRSLSRKMSQKSGCFLRVFALRF
jgi:hypothetical protein